MKKTIILSFLLLISTFIFAQTAKDMVTASDVEVTWLGVDFSHVKLIGEFNQWASGGEKSSYQIQDIYFPAWNDLVLNEPKKFDLEGMLRKNDLGYDTDMIRKKNEEAPLEEMEADSEPDYSKEEIASFIKEYDGDGEGIGVVFIAEALNKRRALATYHFVAFNRSNGEILIHEELKTEPSGFGLRNYWGGSIYRAIKEIRKEYYKKWRSEYTE